MTFGEEKNESSLTAFISTRNHRERFGQLERKEKEIKEGNLESNKAKQFITTDSVNYSIKVSNVPLDLTQQELEDFFSDPVRPRKVFRPVGKEDRVPREFAIIHYNTHTEAEEAILRYNNKKCGYQILFAEMADNRNQTFRPQPPRPRFRK